jgi:hypothetical protein
MREIVTLQFGQQSNYLGTHFWNTQVCMARLFLVLFALLSIYHCFLLSLCLLALNVLPFFTSPASPLPLSSNRPSASPTFPFP